MGTRTRPVRIAAGLLLGALALSACDAGGPESVACEEIREEWRQASRRSAELAEDFRSTSDEDPLEQDAVLLEALGTAQVMRQAIEQEPECFTQREVTTTRSIVNSLLGIAERRFPESPFPTEAES